MKLQMGEGGAGKKKNYISWPLLLFSLQLLSYPRRASRGLGPPGLELCVLRGSGVFQDEYQRENKNLHEIRKHYLFELVKLDVWFILGFIRTSLRRNKQSSS